MRKSRNVIETIAVTGAFPGAGATHMCLCIANYLASIEKRRVVFVELNDRSNLTEMVRGKVIDLDGVLGYEFMDVIYVPDASFDVCKRLLKDKNYYVIVDIGTEIAKYRDICNLCDKIYVVGNFKPWNEDRFGRFIQSNVINLMDSKKVSFFGLETDKAEKVRFQKIFDKELHTMPMIQNPLCIRQKDFKEILQII